MEKGSNADTARARTLRVNTHTHTHTQSAADIAAVFFQWCTYTHIWVHFALLCDEIEKSRLHPLPPPSATTHIYTNTFHCHCKSTTHKDKGGGGVQHKAIHTHTRCPLSQSALVSSCLVGFADTLHLFCISTTRSAAALRKKKQHSQMCHSCCCLTLSRCAAEEGELTPGERTQADTF